MEDSFNPHVIKSVASKTTIDDQTREEESGWTSYLEDFLSNQVDQDHSSCSNHSTFCGPSMISDAASSTAWKSSNNSNHVIECSSKFPRKLSSSKKMRNKKITFDDSLEDTACSPLISTKVGSLKEMGINPGKRDDNFQSSLAKGGGSDHYLESWMKKRKLTNDIDFEGKNNEFTDLKKMGLCLVPLSVVVNYFG